MSPQTPPNTDHLNTFANNAMHYAKENLSPSVVVNYGAEFALEQINRPSLRQKAISEIWTAMSPEEQEKLLSGSITIDLLLQGLIPLYGGYKNFQRAKWLWDNFGGKIPKGKDDILREEIKACVAIGILPVKDPAVYRYVDEDALIAGKIAKGTTMVLNMAGADGEITDVVTQVAKIADAAGEYVKETMPKIRAEVARKTEVNRFRQQTQNRVSTVVNQGANNTANFENPMKRAA